MRWSTPRRNRRESCLRPQVIGYCELSDRAGTEYVNWISSHPSFGMVRIHQRTFVPSPPADTELLELRFSPPNTMPGQAPPLIVNTVDLRSAWPASGLAPFGKAAIRVPVTPWPTEEPF
jgi:hypothetical protein